MDRSDKMKKLRNKPSHGATGSAGDGDWHAIGRRLFDCTARMMAARDPDERNPEEASKQSQRNAEAA
jgi:hypothetical protein